MIVFAWIPLWYITQHCIKDKQSQPHYCCLITMYGRLIIEADILPFISRVCALDSLWPIDAIWRIRYGSIGSGNGLLPSGVTPLSAPMLTSNIKVPWHSTEGIIIGISVNINQWHKLGNCIIEISSRSLRKQELTDYPDMFVIFFAITELAWWHHEMETFSALLALCAGNSKVSDMELWYFLWSVLE